MRFFAIICLVLIGVAAGWTVTRPQPLSPDAMSGLSGDAETGALVFAAAGCASCHAAVEGPSDVLSGGRTFASDFGTFVAPNISSDPVHGVGGWSDLDLASAIVTGVGADGAHPGYAFEKPW